MYLTKNDLISHIPLEILTEIVRDYKVQFANLAAFPAPGLSGQYYIALDTGKYYKWDGVAYNESPYTDIVAKAISEGLGEAKSYLNRYDQLAMFGTNSTSRTFTDDFLDGLVKDIICWRLIKLCNPNIDLKLFRSGYEDAISTLSKVQKGIIDPRWPLRVDDPATTIDDAGNVEWTASPKRSNHY